MDILDDMGLSKLSAKVSLSAHTETREVCINSS